MAASDSPELRTLKVCTFQLKAALKRLDRELVHFLNQEGFINADDVEEVLSPRSILTESPQSILTEADNACELVKWIKNRVKLDPPSYHVLLGGLKRSGYAIVKILEAEYAKQNLQGAPSPELRTLKVCTPQLETALTGLDRELVHFLNHNNFITDDVMDKVRNPVTMLTEADKAWKLVERIKNRVKLDPPSYHVLLGRLKQSGNLYKPIVKILEAEYARQNPQGASSGGIDSARDEVSLGLSTSVGYDIPTYEDYRCCIPEGDRWKLDKKLDFEHHNVDLHLGELAMVFEKWEDISPLLGLTDTEISEIIKEFRAQADQRRAALKKWKSKFGFHATYGTLLKACLRKESLNCAEKIVILLGAAGGPTRFPSSLGSKHLGSVGVPTLREFIKFPMAAGKVNLAQAIGTKYTYFGVLLLEDENGDHTRAIASELDKRAEDINAEIFRLWVKGEGLKPVSWATLVGVLQDMGLDTLARDIEHTKRPKLQ